MNDLSHLVREVLRSNHELSERLKGLGDSNRSHLLHQSIVDQDDTATAVATKLNDTSEFAPRDARGIETATTTTKTSLSKGEGVLDWSLEWHRFEKVPRSGTALRFAFDDVLQNSRVYRRRTAYCHSETSMTSSIRHAAAISIFSALTMGETSNISVFSLPIFAHEVYNSQWYIADIASGFMDKAAKPVVFGAHLHKVVQYAGSYVQLDGLAEANSHVDDCIPYIVASTGEFLKSEGEYSIK